MKFEINNFGPIKNFKIDLDENLQLIYGKNSVGKSYAVSAVYLLIKNILSGKASNIKNEGDFQTIINKIEQKIEAKNFQAYPIPEKYIYQYVKNSFSFFIEEIENSFKNSFSDLKNITNRLNNEDFSIIVEFYNIKFKIKIKNNKLYISDILKFPSIIIKFTTKLKSNPFILLKKKIIYIEKLPLQENYIKEALNYITFDSINEVLKKIKEQYNNIYFLPASRSGLYTAMNTFSSLFVELSQQRQFISKTISLPDISEPVSDYFLNISKINNENENNLADIVNKFENKILKGRVKYDTRTKKLKFLQENIDLSLDLKETSSMIAELTPIVAHLKFIIDKTSILFIEEPETCLHPEIQVEIMKIFAEIATNFNIKLILTSHSNYMFNQLNNLILDKQIDSKITKSSHLVMTKTGSIDNQDMNVTDDGIADNNFANTSKKLYNERMNIYEKLNVE